MFATKPDFIHVLQSNICRVVFRKQDGSERVMNCTLSPDLVDKWGLTPKNLSFTGPDNQVRCVDVDEQQWKSFLVESVLNFEVIK